MKSIVRLSEAASIALHALAYMASHEGTPLTVNQMATRIGMSKNHLAKVLQRLVAGGITTSVQGPKGGYTLNKPASDISFLDVIELIDGPSCDNGCLFGKEDCGLRDCIMGGFLHDITRQAMDFFRSQTLSQFRNWPPAGCYPPGHPKHCNETHIS